MSAMLSSQEVVSVNNLDDNACGLSQQHYGLLFTSNIPGALNLLVILCLLRQKIIHHLLTGIYLLNKLSLFELSIFF